MKYKKNISLIIFLLIVVGSAVGQRQDSTKKKKFRFDLDKHVSPFVVYRSFAVQVDTFTFSNAAISLGGSIKLNGITLTGSIPFITRQRLSQDNDTRVLGLNYNIYGGNYALHLTLRYYDSFPDGLFSLPFRIREPMGHVNLRANYIFSNDFNYQSAFTLLSDGRNSGGGITFSPEVFYYYVSPNLEIQDVPIHFLQARTNLGYAYHYIVRKDYFVSFQLDMGLAFEFDNELIPVRVVDVRYVPISNFKVALGFRGDDVSWLLSSAYTPNRLLEGRAASSSFFINLTFKVRLGVLMKNS